MLSYEKALVNILETITPLTPVGMSLDKTGGLVLAEAVTTRWDMPRADNPEMDGFSVSSKSCTAIPNGAIRSAVKIPAIATATNENTPS
jgi:molybdopterin biosynthesis enzyme